jgi:hypothetical protein
MDDPLKQTPFCELDRDNRVMTLKDLAFTRISLSELEALRADNARLTAELARVRGLPRLSALDAEIARLQTRYDSAADQAVRYADDNARLRTALQDCIDGRRDWIDKARRALEAKP